MNRKLKAARGLYARYLNPDVAAYNNARDAKTEKAKEFWFDVGRYLFKPYSCQVWTDDDIERWNLIRHIDS